MVCGYTTLVFVAIWAMRFTVMLKTMMFGKVPLIVRFNMCLKSKKGEHYDC